MSTPQDTWNSHGKEEVAAVTQVLRIGSVSCAGEPGDVSLMALHADEFIGVVRSAKVRETSSRG